MTIPFEREFVTTPYTAPGSAPPGQEKCRHVEYQDTEGLGD